MKVVLDNYRTWIGPYQIANLLQKVGVSEDKCHDIGGFLAEKTPVGKICEWIHSKKKRKEQVRIDNYDTWNMDHTLSLIIVPMLEQLIATKHGHPLPVDPVDDMPDEIKAPPKDWVQENEWDYDPNTEARWNWVMSEMLWAMKEIRDDNPNEPNIPEFGTAGYRAWQKDTAMREAWRVAYDKYNARVQQGTLLFGKHFQSLWD